MATSNLALLIKGSNFTNDIEIMPPTSFCLSLMLFQVKDTFKAVQCFEMSSISAAILVTGRWIMVSFQWHRQVPTLLTTVNRWTELINLRIFSTVIEQKKGGTILSDMSEMEGQENSSGGQNHQPWRSNYRGDYLNIATISTRDLICWSFQIARGMGYLANRKVRSNNLLNYIKIEREREEKIAPDTLPLVKYLPRCCTGTWPHATSC